MTTMPDVPCQVVLTAEASALINSMALRDRRIAAKLLDHIETLATDPQRKGAPLRGELQGLLSHHCLGNRFRIIYRVDAARRVVTILSLGIRKAGDKRDVYELTKKIIRRLRKP
ncbi:MAG: type II toxin-antitoxin system RelE/ParE family toxin [Deltaproteobacteria bacterium]|nr:type II toxin-antitoxin system RelE/ParE family toxin [Deltaproteobacteria bacterium]